MANRPPPQSSSQFMLGEMSGKLDLILVQFAASEARTQSQINALKSEQETLAADIDSLKQGRSWLLGAAAAVGALGSAVAAAMGIGK